MSTLAGVAAAQAEDWRPVPMLSGRAHRLAAYDSARERIVLWEGDGPSGLGLTWERIRDAWALRRPAQNPPPRTGAAMTYDPLRRRVVLFGGFRDWWQTQLLSDTWEWDGATWTLRPTPASPSPRSHCEAAFDAASGRVLLFGGTGWSPYLLGDTWAFDGANWKQVATVGPTPRFHHAMVGDPSRQRVVLFGGWTSEAVGDTWEWDGGSWTQCRPPSAPGARSGAAMTYDSATQRVMLHGGLSWWPSAKFLDDSWLWDGTSWTPLPSGNAPARYRHALVHVPGSGRTVLVGGWTLNINNGDTWERNGTAWSLRELAVPTAVMAVARDSARARVVVVGDYPRRSVEWDGIGWHAGPVVELPEGRMAYDSNRARTVLVGKTPSAASLQTWEWDGLAWTQRNTPAAPVLHAPLDVAYDPAQQRILVVGVDLARAGMELCEWDGLAWTRRASATSPPPMMSLAVAHDPLQQRLWMVGATLSALETWSWDGQSWTRHVPAASPPVRYDFALGRDPLRARLVLSGGYDLNPFANMRDDAWTWDGATWAPLVTGTAPPARAFHHLLWDPVFQRLMLFGGLRYERNGGTTYLPDVWALDTTAPGASIPTGVGCGGPAGTPTLASSLAFPGARAFSLDLLSVPAHAPAVMGLSEATMARPLGAGCTLYLQPPWLSFLTLANGAGFTNLVGQVPNVPAIRGVSLFAQAVVLDPFGPLLGTSWSNAVRIVVGD